MLGCTSSKQHKQAIALLGGGHWGYMCSYWKMFGGNSNFRKYGDDCNPKFRDLPLGIIWCAHSC